MLMCYLYLFPCSAAQQIRLSIAATNPIERQSGFLCVTILLLEVLCTRCSQESRSLSQVKARRKKVYGYLRPPALHR